MRPDDQGNPSNPSVNRTWLPRTFNLDSLVGRARVGRWRRVWVGRKPRLKTCLRTFGRLEQAMPLARLRPERVRNTPEQFRFKTECLLPETVGKDRQHVGKFDAHSA